MAVLRNGLLTIALFVLTACNSGDVGIYSSETMRNRNCIYTINCSPFPYGLPKTYHMSKEQKKEYFKQQRAQRLQERGREDNSTDGGARFGW